MKAEPALVVIPGVPVIFKGDRLIDCRPMSKEERIDAYNLRRVREAMRRDEPVEVHERRQIQGNVIRMELMSYLRRRNQPVNQFQEESWISI